ncbi:MAG: LytTR family DNA-binding domain-containing protein [Verrucomicrobia bacterium]|nr:LytTR family DNA-binding domain-containing protein [Verrucomicrobiota bacterium]
MNPPAINRAIRAVLVDDEKGARMHLTERLAVHPGIMIVGEADRAQAAIDLIHRAKPDVVFLDVQMPGGTGFSLLPLLGGMCPPPAVVFVTAYDKYALKAFEANALDYLTKPVSPPRLAITIKRLQNLLLATGGAPKDESDASAPPRPLEMRDLVLLREKTSLRMVEAGEICAVEAEADYTHIFLADGHKAFLRKRMSQWEEELPTPPFCKTSRRLLLNTQRIMKIVANDRESAEVHLQGIEKPFLLSRIELRRLRAACG